MRWLESNRYQHRKWLDPEFTLQCHFVATATALALAGLAAAGSIGSAVIGSNAASTASQQQATSDQAAIAEQQRQFNIEQQNSAPFVSAGQQSIGDVMAGINSGKFGPGSTGAVPANFTAPTLAEAQASPGYEFAAQQGSKGILEASAASGGAISGGTSKALQGYETNLANSTYGDVFSRAMQGYQANLAGYGAKLAGQQQEFGQLFAPAQLGSGSTAAINQTGSTSATNIAQLMQSLGTSQAAGTVGSANAISSGIGGATNGISQALLLSKLFGKTPGIQFGQPSMGSSVNDQGVPVG